MKFKKACNSSKDGRAKRSTESEMWIIVDPDARTIVFDIVKYPPFRENRRVQPDSLAEVFHMVVTEDGVDYEKVRWALREEIELYEDWEPIILKDDGVFDLSKIGGNEIADVG